MLEKFCEEVLGAEEEPRRARLEFAFSAKPAPWAFVAGQKAPGGGPLFNFKHGTTTLAFCFRGGIIVAVDSRASMGSFVSSESVRKVIPVNERFLGTMAGGAADCQYWLEMLRYQIALYELNNQESISVAGASQLFANMLYRYRGYGLSLGSMIAGSDETGTHLYYCDDEGKRVKSDRFAVGSGGTYAYGVLDTHYDFELSLEQAVELGRRAISEATFADSGSGGLVRVCHVFPGGWRWMVPGDNASELVWAHRRANNAL